MNGSVRVKLSSAVTICIQVIAKKFDIETDKERGCGGG
jgi:hypothetical protein